MTNEQPLREAWAEWYCISHGFQSKFIPLQEYDGTFKVPFLEHDYQNFKAGVRAAKKNAKLLDIIED